MYEQFYGLDEQPFELTPDPQYLLLTSTHQEALGTLEYGVCARKGVILLLGDAGMGKTTLLRSVLTRKLGRTNESVQYLYLNNPTLSRREFYQLLVDGFGLTDAARQSKAMFLQEFEAHVAARHQRGDITALVIDEAQSLPHALLEELRLLTNLASDSAMRLSLVLAGQPEFATRLNDPGLRQLKQRIALRSRLIPLNLVDTAAYISGRVRLAGGEVSCIFSREAVVAVFSASKGIPRLVSVICDNALLAGFAADERPVTRQTVESVCRDLDLACLPIGSESTTRPAVEQVRPPTSMTAKWYGRLRQAATDRTLAFRRR